MANPSPLKRIVLRQMLLEGDSGPNIIKAVRRFKKGKKTTEDHQTLVNLVRGEITDQSKSLMENETIHAFIAEISLEVSVDSVLD